MSRRRILALHGDHGSAEIRRGQMRPLARRAGLCFAIMVGGLCSADARHDHLYDAPGGITMSSLHVIGRNATNETIVPAVPAVPAPASRALASRFATARRQPLHAAPDHAPSGSPGPGAPARGAASPPPEPPAPPAPLDVPLWPGRAHPTMRIHFPDGDRSRTRPAMLVFRGGAYARSDGSGAGSAAWLARQGMLGIEVEYGTRATREVHPAAYADAARAVRLVRHHARAWGVDPTRVGILGYSAGGHLASLLSTQPTLQVAPDDDLAATLSARPDLVVLGYPVISFVEQYVPGAFVGSVENFFGRDDVGEPLRRHFSNELHVAPGHPPVFLWTTADDALVPAAHAERFAEACRRAHVPIAFTLYPHGPHGMGLALDRPADQPGDVGRWTVNLLAWLAEQWGRGDAR